MELAEFAEKNPPRHGKLCWICTLPEIDEIDSGLRSGIPPSIIERWLIDERGYEIEGNIRERLQSHKGRIDAHARRRASGRA